jgi:hypothetical protein
VEGKIEGNEVEKRSPGNVVEIDTEVAPDGKVFLR